ncbi:MAG: tetratricopeptide repeat protein [Candidatus Riflebacteria bacterium]|nr:tetratricopeptide repeat protein [Candidatus Riflebacteria bacterium]
MNCNNSFFVQFFNISSYLTFVQIVVFAFLFFLSPLFADSYDDYLKTGQDHLNLFHYKEAGEFFKKATEVNPNRIEAFYQLGVTQKKLNDIESAIKNLEKAISIAPDDLDTEKALAGIYIKLAKDFRQSNNKDEMLKYLKKAIFSYPQNTSGAATLFEMLGKAQQWDEIIAFADKFKKANKDGIDAGDDKNLQNSLIWIAQSYVEKKDLAKARDFVRSAGMIHHPNDSLSKLQKELPEETKTISVSLVAEAKDLLTKGDLKKALEKIKEAQDASPDDQEINDLFNKVQSKMALSDFVREADSAEKAGKYSEALEFVNRAIGLNEENQQLRKKAEFLNQKLDEAEKLKAQKRALELTAKKAQFDQSTKLNSLLKAAKENERRGSFSSAKIIYEQALAIATDSQEIKDSLARVTKSAQEGEARVKKLGQNLAQASRFMMEEKYDEAYALLKEAIDEPLSKKEEVFPLIIECSIKLEKIENAEKFTEAFAKIASKSAKLTFYQGLIAFKKEDYPAACEIFGTLPPTYNENTSEISSMKWIIRYHKYKIGIFLFLLIFGWKVTFGIWEMLKSFWKSSQLRKIESYLATGKFEKVIPLIEKQLADSEALPNRKALMASLADSYLKTNRFHDAKERALEVLAKDPKNAVVNRIIGEACFQLGDTSPEGLERISNLLKIDENRKDVMVFLVNFFKSQNNDNKMAIDLMQKYISICPDDSETLLYIAEIYLRRSSFSSTNLKIFERASKFFPDREEFLHGFAQCLIQSGKREEAEKVMDIGSKKWPDSELFPARRAAKEKSPSSELPSRSSLQQASNSSSPSNTSRTETPLRVPKVSSSRVETPIRPSVPKPPSTRVETPIRPSVSKVSIKTQIPESEEDGTPAIAFKMPDKQSISKPSASKAPSETIVCQSCKTENPTREYYCSKCGKPLA